MPATCDRCRDARATVHWTEIIAGSVLERHLCDACREEELAGMSPVENVLRFECRCGEVMKWRFPHGACGHPADAYEIRDGEVIEIGQCGCGARYVVEDPRWTCRICGAISIVPPRDTGGRGLLHDHIHGEREAVEIRIRAFMP